MHDVYTARLFCWQPTSGILTGGIVVGQDVAIRVAEFHTLGHRPDKYIPRNNLQPGEFLYIIDRPLQRPLSYTILDRQLRISTPSNIHPSGVAL